MPRGMAPVTDDDNRFFWEGVQEGRLLIQLCEGCGALRHPPGPMCPRCLSLEWGSVQSGGGPTVASSVGSAQPTEPDADPRVVVLGHLEEGVRLVANLQGTPAAEVTNGLAVEAFFAAVDGVR